MGSLIIRYHRVFTTLFTILALLGVVSWMTMPKEEDPKLKERYGTLQVVVPGATIEEIHRLVARPLFDELAEINEIKDRQTTIRKDFMLVQIELTDAIGAKTDIDQAWYDVRMAVDRANQQWPTSVRSYELSRKALEQDAIVYVIENGSAAEQLQLGKALEDRLLGLPNVSKINFFGDIKEQIRIDLDDKRSADFGLSRLEVFQQIQKNNRSLPAGSLNWQGRALSLNSNSYFQSIEDIQSFPLLLKSGRSIELQDIADVKLTSAEPREDLVRFNGKEVLSLGVVPKDRVNLMKFGQSVRDIVSEFQSLNSNYKVTEVSFQPDNVDERLSDLTHSLLMGIGIVALIITMIMGLRMGFISAMVIPVISLIALAMFAALGGVLHQISIAAFVLSLGLLIDNVIVILESIQEKKDNGISSTEATRTTIEALALPLLAATGTTLASFFPMLGSAGSTADFTRSIPLIAVLTLSVSFFFSILVTPSLGRFLLRPGNQKSTSWIQTLGSRVGGLAARFPKTITAMSVLVLIGSLMTAPFVKKQFFPSADRRQLVVDLRLAEGSRLQSTKRATIEFEKLLNEIPTVKNVTAYIGRSTPAFFYNLQRVPRAPHVAQFIVEFDSPRSARENKQTIRELARNHVAEAVIVVRSLEQGPPVKAPIEIQVQAPNRKQAGQLGDEIIQKLRQVPGAIDVRSDYGTGLPVLEMQINDSSRIQFFQSRTGITSQIYSLSTGLEVSEYLAAEDSIPIVLASEQGENNSIEQMMSTYLASINDKNIKLSEVLQNQLRFSPAVLTLRNGTPVVTILSELKQGYGFEQVLNPIKSEIESMTPPPFTEIRYGGASSESEAANTAILKAMPLGLLVLLISLLVQFNSFRKILIILFCAPMAMVGVFPGLLLSGLEFGFFSVLGILALVGIVVNNGILLIDVMDTKIKEGSNVDEAIAAAVSQRLRPIWLTTLTTVAGLLPLVFTSATLWPPFAITMIFGLLASAVLSPLFVSALYKIIFATQVERVAVPNAVPALLIALVVVMSPDAQTEELKLLQFTQHSLKNHRSILKQEKVVQSSEMQTKAASRNLSHPKLFMTVDAYQNDKDLLIDGPFGITFEAEQRSQLSAAIAVQQPLYNPNVRVQKNLSRKNQEIQKHALEATRETVALESAKAYLSGVKINRIISNLDELAETLRSRKQEIQRLYDLGRVSKVDLTKIQMALSDLQVDRLQLANQKLVLIDQLNRWAKTGITDFIDEDKLTADLSFHRAPARIQLTQRSIELSELKMKQVDAQQLPQLNLTASYARLDPSGLTEPDVAKVMLQLRWELWAGGTRSAQMAQEVALRDSATQAHQLEVENLQSLLFQKSRAIEVAKETVKQHQSAYAIAKSVASSEWQRYKKGQTTLNDVLEADQLAQAQKQRYQVAEIDESIAIIEKLDAQGVLVSVVTREDP